MTISFVQAKTNYLGGGTDASLTMDAAPTQNNLLVAAIRTNGDITATIVAAAGGWTYIGSGIVDAASGYSRMAWKPAGAGESATQIPFDWTGSQNRAVIIAEYSSSTGWDASPVEANTGNTDADATKTTTGSCDPTDAVLRLIVGMGSSDGNRTFSAEKVNGSTTGVNERGDIGGGTTAGGDTVCLFDLIETSTVSGNYTSESVASALDDGAALMAIFKPAAGGPATFTATATLSIELGLVSSALNIGITTATPGIQMALAPVAVGVGITTATPGIQLALAPAGTRAVEASATIGIQLALAPTDIGVGVTTATPGIQLALAPSALAVGITTATLGIELGLAPSAGDTFTATATLGIQLALAPAATGVGVTTATPGITLGLAPSAVGVGITTATPGIQLALAPSGIKVTATTATLGIQMALAPAAVKAVPTSTTLGIQLALAPSGVKVGVSSATPGIQLSLTSVALGVGRTTATPGIQLTLTPTALAVSLGAAGPVGTGDLVRVEVTGSLEYAGGTGSLTLVLVQGTLTREQIEGTLVRESVTGSLEFVDTRDGTSVSGGRELVGGTLQRSGV